MSSEIINNNVLIRKALEHKNGAICYIPIFPLLREDHYLSVPLWNHDLSPIMHKIPKTWVFQALIVRKYL